MKLAPLTSVEYVYVTCDMTPPELDLSAQELASVHRQQGYSNIAVHFVIRRNGRMETGRSLNVRGAKAPSHADTSVQVSLCGGLTSDRRPRGDFTSAQLRTLRALSRRFNAPLRLSEEPPVKRLKGKLNESKENHPDPHADPGSHHAMGR